MPQCIYCRTYFETSSGEHIIQNSLGTRWTCDRIVCNTHQTEFGQTIDLELSKQIVAIRNLFEIETGRGGEPRTLERLQTTDGRKRSLAPGGKLELSEPEVNVDTNADGSRSVRMSLRDHQDIGWALHKLREIDPTIKISPEDVRQFSVSKPLEADATVIIKQVFGGELVHRAVAKAVLNYLGALGIDVLHDGFDGIRNFVLSGNNGKSEDFCRFSYNHKFDSGCRLGRLGHGIYVHSHGTRIEAFVQLYGFIDWSLLLSNTYTGKPLSIAYLADPERKHSPSELRQESFDAREFPAFANQAPLPGPKLWGHMSAKYNQVLDYYVTQQSASAINGILADVLGPPNGQKITPEQVAKIKRRVAEFMAETLLKSVR